MSTSIGVDEKYRLRKQGGKGRKWCFRHAGAYLGLILASEFFRSQVRQSLLRLVLSSTSLSHHLTSGENTALDKGQTLATLPRDGRNPKARIYVSWVPKLWTVLSWRTLAPASCGFARPVFGDEEHRQKHDTIFWRRSKLDTELKCL